MYFFRAQCRITPIPSTPQGNVSETIAPGPRPSALNSNTPAEAKIQFKKVQEESGGPSFLPCALSQPTSWVQQKKYYHLSQSLCSCQL